MEAFHGVGVTRVRAGVRTTDRDRAATEEPLEVRLYDKPFAVIMRTPGADRELAAGFLLAEGVIKSADDLGTIEYCTDPSAEHPENIVNATLVNGSAASLEKLLAGRRNVTTNSSCGMCGRLTIDSLKTNLPALVVPWTVPAATIVTLPDALRRAQSVFEETGGLHAAGLFTREGALETIAEDVGRHNAVDKVIGRMVIQERLPLTRHMLFVSGRTSFEIVQKAFLAGIPLVAAVSAPSSLAIELAEECGITLIGFLRGQNFNIYTHPERVTT
ncbi:MAG TPA: formate dehydrogenase accessory sulfurtransferase FdhD [Vicinamibacterales bacterium]|nr:formate dehydrogenase accessory sulfurtransferase FdhD [Vicinamibacterales bacterium]